MQVFTGIKNIKLYEARSTKSSAIRTAGKELGTQYLHSRTYELYCQQYLFKDFFQFFSQVHSTEKDTESAWFWRCRLINIALKKILFFNKMRPKSTIFVFSEYV